MLTAILAIDKNYVRCVSGLFREGHYRPDGEDIIVKDSISDVGEEVRNIWLYNIKKDPFEYINLADEYPSIVVKLLKRLTYYNSTAVPCIKKPGEKYAADPSKHGDLWGPWQEDT